jgi:tetratricopeptide (TPR) repeat protein
MAIPFLFLYLGIAGPGLWRSLGALLSAPSIKHLTGLITGKPFLVLVVLYLACVCVSFELQARGRGVGEDDEDDPRWRKGKAAFELGWKAFLEKNSEEALKHFDEAIQCGFSREGIYGSRGSCLQILGFDFDAIDDFNKGISLDPAGDSNLYYMRSVSRRAIGDDYGCIADLKEAIRLSRGGDKEGFEIMAKGLGWDSVSSYYESQLRMALIDLDLPEGLRAVRFRGNLKKRRELDLPALPEPLG